MPFTAPSTEALPYFMESISVHTATPTQLAMLVFMIAAEASALAK